MRRLSPGPLVVATHNEGKLGEIAALVASLGLEPCSAGSLGLPVPEETEASFAGNALLKAHAAARASGIVALADDSGLEVEALGGRPGVHTADWAETPTGRDWAQAMRRVEDELARLGPAASRRARFVCALALAWPDGAEAVFEGRVEGRLVWPPRGDLGFGYDPMFAPLGSAQTYGEMDPAHKHATSHRARAFALMMQACAPS